MNRVLIFHQTFITTGGVESRHFRLAQELPKHGWHVIFGLAFGGRFHDPYRFRSLYPGLDTLLLDGRTGSRDGRILGIVRAIQRANADVIISGGLVDSFAVLRDMKHQGSQIRHVVGIPGNYAAMLSYIRRQAPYIDRAYAVSKLLAKALTDICGLPPSRVDYVPSGVPRAARGNDYCHGSSIRLGYIGRLHFEKRALDLKPLCEELDQRNVSFTLKVAGDGPLREQVYEALAPWIARKSVHLIPTSSMTSVYQDIYPHLDACLLFSADEGQPNCLMEAMAHGVVPVTAKYRGLAMQGLVQHKVTGMVFPVGDMNSAADHILGLKDDPQLFSQLSRQAREYVSSEHSLDRMGQAFAEMLNRSLQDDPRRGDGLKQSHNQTILPGVGGKIREQLRRFLGRRFPHQTSVEEWPDMFVEQAEDLLEIEEAMGRLDESFDFRPATSLAANPHRR